MRSWRQCIALPMRPAWKGIRARGLHERAHSILEAVPTDSAEPPMRTRGKQLMRPWRQVWGWIGAARGAVQKLNGLAGVGSERPVVANGPDGALNTTQIDAQRRR